MADYPDNMQLFWLYGVNITIPINIESSDITLPISIDAVSVDLDVNIIASEVTIDFNFADQSVAVFDAAKWFAHQAEHVYIHGLANVGQNSELRAITYTVPANKNLYIVGLGYRMEPLTTVMHASGIDVRIGATIQMEVGSVAGHAVLLDTPMRFTAGQNPQVWAHQYSTMANVYARVAMWGYLEDAE